jgi:hypothetical protein
MKIRIYLILSHEKTNIDFLENNLCLQIYNLSSRHNTWPSTTFYFNIDHWISLDDWALGFFNFGQHNSLKLELLDFDRHLLTEYANGQQQHTIRTYSPKKLVCFFKW